MGKINKYKSSDYAASSKPTLDQIKRDLVDRCQQKGFDTGFAKYFWTEVCPPYNPKYEQPHMVAVQGAQNSTRWVEPYRMRIMQCLESYFAMSANDRTLLHSGVEEGVKWKGEPIAQYLDTCSETVRMREVGLDAYRKIAKEAIGKIINKGESQRDQSNT